MSYLSQADLDARIGALQAEINSLRKVPTKEMIIDQLGMGMHYAEAALQSDMETFNATNTEITAELLQDISDSLHRFNLQVQALRYVRGDITCITSDVREVVSDARSQASDFLDSTL